MRKGYQKKREFLEKALDKYFKNKYKVVETSSNVEVKVAFDFQVSKGLLKSSEKNGVKLKSTESENQFIFIFAGLEDQSIHEGIKTLARSWNII